MAVSCIRSQNSVTITSAHYKGYRIGVCISRACRIYTRFTPLTAVRSSVCFLNIYKFERLLGGIHGFSMNTHPVLLNVSAAMWIQLNSCI